MELYQQFVRACEAKNLDTILRIIREHRHLDNWYVTPSRTLAWRRMAHTLLKVKSLHVYAEIHRHLRNREAIHAGAVSYPVQVFREGSRRRSFSAVTRASTTLCLPG